MLFISDNLDSIFYDYNDRYRHLYCELHRIFPKSGVLQISQSVLK